MTETIYYNSEDSSWAIVSKTNDGNWKTEFIFHDKTFVLESESKGYLANEYKKIGVL